ncbi:CoA transferase [Gordonia sp. ABSL49_1]|uniref:CoA transferase n=1 Tax=unclassified Gordonia (in: high G+C Gram-positive bacteria) TaxID=2657482 RepID=UPI001F112CED|nr:CoA transferase [Gordonia sp. ABSL49_1]MCH5644629.1 CoA transferase [Gordonia sp. ABSL49_1]
MIVDDWATSGLATLTGHSDGLPDLSRAPVLHRAREVLDRFVTATDNRDVLTDLDAGEFLSGRAGLTGHTRNGRISAGGATRLIRAADGWFALSLARPDDVDLVPALLSGEMPDDDPWTCVERAAQQLPAADVVSRARLLGLAAAIPGEADPRPPTVESRGTATDPRELSDLLVADLSSLWAGPLCTHLLARAGATVVKVESRSRPDGARRGNRDFFDWMNGGKLSYAVDLHDDKDNVARLLSTADVVVEASRPRALQRHGLASDQLPARPGQVWVRLTAHGSSGSGADWVGFGDDAAVAGGLTAQTPTGPVFVGDAIADPLTGLEAAATVAESLARGGGLLIDTALSQVAATYAGLGVVEKPTTTPEVSTPRPPRREFLAAADLGADNAAIRAQMAGRT